MIRKIVVNISISVITSYSIHYTKLYDADTEAHAKAAAEKVKVELEQLPEYT